ncbi:BMP family lipoprotein [Caldalkalibacillus mannanilyticus]|uniref:BMP family lipoprotein n=1 Tax=Caldalkalibacillus mannanilyticus TaxID=1418 RepID=UPI00046AB0BA|nr:BMP family ABC transporter substrate-binding protein [Caldalkalibacillus mannanilyticus]
MKKAKVFSQLLVLMLVLGLVLAACGQAPAEPEATPGAEAPEQPPAEQTGEAFKVAMVTDVGGVDDNSFNQSAWEGHERMEQELGYQVAYLQSTSDDQYQPNLNQLVRQGNDLIWGIGFMMADDIAEVAAANPDSQFAIVDFVYTDNDGNLAIPDNVVSVAFDEHEGSFLVGLIAGHMTKTNKVGFLGGVKFALIEKFEYGFMAGVKAANPDVEVIRNYAGAFDKADLGQQFASTMYDQGADIIYHASGGTGDGVFIEAKQRNGVWVIGVDKDQSFLGEEVTLTSMVKRVDNAVYSVSQETADTAFPGGQIRSFGLAEDGVGIAATQTNLTADVLKLVEEFRQKIINGEIKVPQTEAEYAEYEKTLK